MKQSTKKSFPLAWAVIFALLLSALISEMACTPVNAGTMAPVSIGSPIYEKVSCQDLRKKSSNYMTEWHRRGRILSFQELRWSCLSDTLLKTTYRLRIDSASSQTILAFCSPNKFRVKIIDHEE